MMYLLKKEVNFDINFEIKIKHVLTFCDQTICHVLTFWKLKENWK
jgi:hypothetical protein